jgi:hypothetical protein
MLQILYMTRHGSVNPNISIVATVPLASWSPAIQNLLKNAARQSLALQNNSEMARILEGDAPRSRMKRRLTGTSQVTTPPCCMMYFVYPTTSSVGNCGGDAPHHRPRLSA